MNYSGSFENHWVRILEIWSFFCFFLSAENWTWGCSHWATSPGFFVCLFYFEVVPLSFLGGTQFFCLSLPNTGILGTLNLSSALHNLTGWILRQVAWFLSSSVSKPAGDIEEIVRERTQEGNDGFIQRKLTSVHDVETQIISSKTQSKEQRYLAHK